MSDYEKKLFGLWQNCQLMVNGGLKGVVLDIPVKTILANQKRYESVGITLGIPFWVIGCIHSRESSLNFNRHLHNGDALTARTVHMPAGRPVDGQPPFLWEESAKDALSLVGFHKFKSWDAISALIRMEAYNGFGYRHRNLTSPYLWNFTNHYTSGKFVADGKFDPKIVDAQPGVVAIMLKLRQCGVDLNEIYPD